MSSFNFGDLGGGVSSLFGAIGDFQEGSAYEEAAKLADKNAQEAALSGAIQQNAEKRQMYQVQGATEAAIGANNGAISGSGLDAMKSNAQQGSLQRSLTGLQTNINVTGYEEQAAAYRGMAQAANTGGIGGLFSGALKLFAALPVGG